MIRPLVIFAMAGLVSACGGRETPSDLVPAGGAVPGLAGRRCEYLAQRPTTDDIEALTRPGTRGAILLQGRSTADADSMEVSVRYRHDGQLDWVRAIRSTAGGTRTSELEQSLAAGLAEPGPGDWGFRLRFVGGSLEAVLPSVVCPPAQVSSTVPRVMPPTGTSRELNEAYRARRGAVVIEVSLDATGRVLEVRLPVTTGSRLLDRYVLDLARAMPFEPKLHDGMGVPSTTTVRFRFPRN
jgi:TonB family protein